MGEEKPKRTFQEEIEVAGNEVVGRVKELIEQGNVRRIIVRNAEDRVLLEIPLTAGVVAGGAMVAFLPALAALGAFAALVARVKIEVIREIKEGEDLSIEADQPESSKKKVEILVDDEEESVAKRSVNKAENSVDRADEAVRKLKSDPDEDGS